MFQGPGIGVRHKDNFTNSWLSHGLGVRAWLSFLAEEMKNMIIVCVAVVVFGRFFVDFW